MVQTKSKKVIFTIGSFFLLLAILLITFNQIRINTHIHSYITKDGWSTVANSYSFFNTHYAKITNNANNVGDVEIRVVDILDSSKIIIDPTVVQTRQSYKTGKIKASNYMIQAKAINEAGNYVIHVDGF